MKVAIVDYGMCNLDSVARAVEECGGSAVVTSRAEDLEMATQIILPGVGAFPLGMKHLRDLGLIEAIQDQALGKRIPFLGICLGMQLLATTGWEVERTEGLGWIEGDVQRLLPNGEDRRIPHVGWNAVEHIRDCPLFKDIPSGKDYYFVHSYHLVCHDESQVVARTPYCGGFVSAIWKDNLFGVQFHPEKSQRLGFQVLRNFLRI